MQFWFLATITDAILDFFKVVNDAKVKQNIRKHGVIIENGLVVDYKEPLEKNSKDGINVENNVRDEIK